MDFLTATGGTLIGTVIPFLVVLTVVVIAKPVVDEVLCCFCFLRRRGYTDVVLQ